VLPLSGGRDSRQILLWLAANGSLPDECVTAENFPPLVSRDLEVAAELCRAVGVPHRVLPQPEDFVPLELRKNLIANLCTDEHAWFMVVADRLRERTRTVYDGLGGDRHWQSHRLTAERCELAEQGRFGDLADTVLKAGGEHVLSNILVPEVRRRLTRERARAVMVRAMRRHADAPNPVESFFYESRSRREIALCPYRLLDGAGTVYSPYLDHDLYDLMASLPARQVLDRNLHTEVIRAGYPQYARVPFAAKHERRNFDAAFFTRYARDAFGFVRRHRPVELLRGVGVFSRLLRCSILGACAPSMEWYGPRILYLAQLETLCRGEGLTDGF
jgi:hypothetical protein